MAADHLVFLQDQLTAQGAWQVVGVVDVVDVVHVVDIVDIIGVVGVVGVVVAGRRGQTEGKRKGKSKEGSHDYSPRPGYGRACVISMWVPSPSSSETTFHSTSIGRAP
ncbi:MAG: hypothetical protein CVU65_03840 [Deltaproteobacteria bacterium HGW-Deltaproteobacteria-22]|nr:MAG: hypothetical protein CVU65_03840 [Deltaproteobacteria bacterium HGW-Deltaproteobacteria-22]